jgi:hypothetical protein
MNNNVNRGNSIVKTKNMVWEIKIGVYSPVLISQHTKNLESKPWEIKVILN